MKPIDVKKWLLLSMVGHALVMTKSGWHLTACGTFTPNGTVYDKLPRAICNKCKARLAYAYPIKVPA